MSRIITTFYEDYSEIDRNSTTFAKSFHNSKFDLPITLSTKESLPNKVWRAFCFQNRQELALVRDWRVKDRRERKRTRLSKVKHPKWNSRSAGGGEQHLEKTD